MAVSQQDYFSNSCLISVSISFSSNPPSYLLYITPITNIVEKLIKRSREIAEEKFDVDKVNAFLLSIIE